MNRARKGMIGRAQSPLQCDSLSRQTNLVLSSKEKMESISKDLITSLSKVSGTLLVNWGGSLEHSDILQTSRNLTEGRSPTSCTVVSMIDRMSSTGKSSSFILETLIRVSPRWSFVLIGGRCLEMDAMVKDGGALIHSSWTNRESV